ncbi:hypothetical protein Tco_0888509, partial [Tanacetum coccineum]
GASFTQRTISSISVGGSINLEGFLSSILLSVVIIVTVVIVVVILIVVVVDDVPFILKLSFVIIEYKEKDSFDPRVQAPFYVESTDDEDSDEEIQDANDAHAYRFQITQVIEDIHVIITPVNPEGQKKVPLCHLASSQTCSTPVQTQDQVKEQVKAQVSKILPKIEKTINEQLEAEVLTRSSNESKTSHVVAVNISELELKKILIDKMESNKSIHRSDEQRNLYKALVDAYESDKLILDTYEDTILFKRHRDDEDKYEEPSAGSNQGSKRRRARKNQRHQCTKGKDLQDPN